MSKHTTGLRPTHHIFVVEGEGDSAHWTKIGAAWQHADGQGLNLTLNMVPLNGRIVVRTVKGEDTQTGQRNGQ